MKVTVERSSLLKALGHVHRVVEKRNTIAILSNVLLRAEDGKLYLKATDLEIEVTDTLPADVAKSGSTTVSAHTLYDIVRKLPDGAQLSLETSDDTSLLTLKAGRSQFSLQSLPASEFPDISAIPAETQFTLPAGDVKKLIEKTKFAISTEETRYYLNGIYLHALEDKGTRALRAVATDGHRLARVDVAAPEGAIGMPGIIVPRKAVEEILKLIEDPTAPMAIELSANKLRISLGDLVLTTKLIDGTFPDYARVIPQNNDKWLTLDRVGFISAVDRVSTISNERGRAVKMSLSAGKLELSVNNPDSGSANEELEADYDNDDLDIGFNARYLLDITTQIDSDTALFKMSDAGSPTLITDRDGASALYVLMPMRV